MRDDLRFAIRSLLRSPGFTVAGVLVLALGIGAVGAMFVLIDAYYLRPLPGVAEPGRLVNVETTLGGQAVSDLTYLDYADLRAWSRAFSGLAAWRSTVLDVGQGSDTRRIQAALVSSSYFAVIGAGVARGRGFLPDEERPAHAHPVAVISHRLWQTVFAADSGIVGRLVPLNGRSFTVVGVAARGFRGHLPAEAADIWVPLSMCVEASPEGLVSLDNRAWRWLYVVGRLSPGMDLAAARAEADVLARRLQAAGAGGGSDFGLSLEPTRGSPARSTYNLLLMAGVSVLFLAVCANLSSLFLARASSRRREIATRLALGAPRSRVVRRLLAESLMLGLLGGVVGFAVASPTATALLAWSTARIGEFSDAVDLGASTDLAAFVLAVSLASGLLLGLGPALQVSRVDVATSLREGFGGRAPGRSRLRGMLVVAQLAISLVLLSGGGLLLKTLRNYRSLVTVPDPQQVLLVSVQPSHQGYDAERAREYFRQLLERVEHVPGVRSATVARDVSVSDASFFQAPVAAERSTLASGAAPLRPGYDVIAPDYFRTMATALVRGRDFTVGDRIGAPPVVIVNQTLARRLWPGAEPVGRVLWIAGESAGREVVGVAQDRPTSNGPRPFLYYPLYQRYPWPGSMHVLQVRASGRPLALLAALRREDAALDAGVPLFDPRILERAIEGERFFERLAGVIMGGSGLAALLLAAIGLYGVTSHWVALRTQEIGVRMALGAGTDRLLGVVIGQALRLALAGVAIGLVVALALNRVWSSLLYGARPADPVVLAAVSLLLIGTALLASYVPARRATKVDPMVALRCE
jgi:predicted permease